MLRECAVVKRRRRPVPLDLSAFAGFRFPPEVTMLAVRWYLRFGLSYRDLEELLAERGIEVDHVTLFRWVQRFTPLLVDAARPCRHAVGARWFVDETYVKVAGIWCYVYRAIDQHGQFIDVLVSQRRDHRSTVVFRGGRGRARSPGRGRHRLRRGVGASWATCYPTRCTTPSSTPTIGSSATTVDSKPGSDRCAASRPNTPPA